MSDPVNNWVEGSEGVRPSPSFYPVSLDLRGRHCLVVGGGRVAVRKVTGLLDAGAHVSVVAPEIDERLEALAAQGMLDLHRRAYTHGEAAHYRLVITATGVDAVDTAVAHDADGAGVWVNSADDPANCSFILPAVHRDGPISIALSSGGASPAMVSWLRDRIEGFVDDLLGDATGDLVGLLADARARVKAAGRSTEHVDWRALLDGPLPGLVRAGRLDEAQCLVDRAID